MRREGADRSLLGNRPALERKGTAALRVLGHLLAGVPPTPGIDWEAIEELSLRHGVAPLLFWRLKQSSAAWQDVPEETKQRLQSDFYMAVARTVVAEWQLAEAIAALIEADVQAIVLKGPAIGAYYPDPGLRAYNDLDLLVRHEQLARTEMALGTRNYRAQRHREWSTESEYACHLPPMTGDDGSLPLEVHWKLDYPEGIGHFPIGDVWERAAAWSVEGQQTLRLDAVDAALQLCSHAIVKHRAHFGLRSICDLTQITARWDQGEWEALAQRTAEFGLEGPVRLMLTLMEQTLGLAAPASVMGKLGRFAGGPLPDDLAERLLGTDDATIAVPIAVVQGGVKARPVARARHIFARFFPQRDAMAVVYNVPADSPRIWLTYLWRPVDLLRRYGRVAWDTLRGDAAARAAWKREVWLERWLREVNGVGR